MGTVESHVSKNANNGHPTVVLCQQQEDRALYSRTGEVSHSPRGACMKSPMAVRIETTWSEAEKKIARKAFDRAFERQCGTITEEAKRMLATSSPPHGIWQVHDYLSRERRKVDQTYDYRYSVLISVFANLLRQGWLKRADLAGLRPDKIELIESWMK